MIKFYNGVEASELPDGILSLPRINAITDQLDKVFHRAGTDWYHEGVQVASLTHQDLTISREAAYVAYGLPPEEFLAQAAGMFNGAHCIVKHSVNMELARDLRTWSLLINRKHCRVWVAADAIIIEENGKLFPGRYSDTYHYAENGILFEKVVL